MLLYTLNFNYKGLLQRNLLYEYSEPRCIQGDYFNITSDEVFFTHISDWGGGEMFNLPPPFLIFEEKNRKVIISCNVLIFFAGVSSVWSRRGFLANVIHKKRCTHSTPSSQLGLSVRQLPLSVIQTLCGPIQGMVSPSFIFDQQTESN